MRDTGKWMKISLENARFISHEQAVTLEGYGSIRLFCQKSVIHMLPWP